MDPATRKSKEILANHYGSRFVKLVVYGSTARGEDDSQSDVDLLVLLRGPFDYFRELRTITYLLYPLQLESSRLISARPAVVEEFEQGSVLLYRNALREGIRV